MEEKLSKLRIDAKRINREILEIEIAAEKKRQEEIESRQKKAQKEIHNLIQSRPIYLIERKAAWHHGGIEGIISYELDENRANEVATELKSLDEYNRYNPAIGECDSPCYAEDSQYRVIKFDPQQVVTSLFSSKHADLHEYQTKLCKTNIY